MLEFNIFSGKEQPIDFIVTTCLKGTSKKPTDSNFLTFKLFMKGKYVKYNNNYGYINSTIPDD